MNPTEALVEASKKLTDAELETFATGGCSDNFIGELERRLNTKLPPSYRLFLQEYGILEVEGDEFYGEIEDEDVGSAIPSFIFATETARALGEIGAQDVYIKSAGHGPIYILDCREVEANREAAVFIQCAEFDTKSGDVKYTRSLSGESFGHFFLGEIDRKIISKTQTKLQP